MKTLEGQLEFLAIHLEYADFPSKAGDIRSIIEADLVDDFKKLFKKKKQTLKLPLDIFNEDHLEDKRQHPKGSEYARPWDEDLIEEDLQWEKVEQRLRDFEKAN